MTRLTTNLTLIQDINTDIVRTLWQKHIGLLRTAPLVIKRHSPHTPSSPFLHYGRQAAAYLREDYQHAPTRMGSISALS